VRVTNVSWRSRSKGKTRKPIPAPARDHNIRNPPPSSLCCATSSGMSPPYILYKAERKETEKGKYAAPSLVPPPPLLPRQSSRPSFGPMPHPHQSRRRRLSSPPRVLGTLVASSPIRRTRTGSLSSQALRPGSRSDSAAVHGNGSSSFVRRRTSTRRPFS
jgi:hypothetical protein